MAHAALMPDKFNGHLDIKTRSVEKALEPLVIQVTTLVNSNMSGNSQHGGSRPTGQSKKAHVLVAAVEKATDDFIRHGQAIADEHPEMRSDLLTVIGEIRDCGAALSNSAREFADDPCSSERRAYMVQDSRMLLSVVTRLLILADMVDVNALIGSLRIIEEDIEGLRDATSQQEVVSRYETFGSHVVDLSREAARRQQELTDGRLRDDLASARATLKRNQMMLLTASKAFVRHPELAAAKENRDYVLQQVSDAVSTMQDVARGQAPTAMGLSAYDEPGELAAALDEFDERIIMHPFEYHEVRSREMLEKQLESIITGAAWLADLSCTREDRKERIVAECNSVRQALQELLSEYLSNVGVPEPSGTLDAAIEYMCRKTRDLRRQLRKAVVDHVSDSFLETNVPLLVLLEAARAGDEVEVDEYGQVFEEHAKKLVEVAQLACSMSEREDGVKMVRYATAQIQALYPQVINAARVLAARPQSKVAQDNVSAFRTAWEQQVLLLTDAVDDITTIDDFLAVSESHILEDINRCVIAASQERDAESVDRTAGAIRGRCARVANVVEAEMENYEPGVYTSRVLGAVAALRAPVLAEFTERVAGCIEALAQSAATNTQIGFDENVFIESARVVYDAIRDVRRTVMLNRSPDEIESDTDLCDGAAAIDAAAATMANMSFANDEIVSPSDTAEKIEEMTLQQQMLLLPAEEKAKIAAQVEVFKIEKTKFDKEIAKWDDTGNDVIVLAKHMCMIMMEMTDFTRGKGPLRTTNDVIKAAQKISDKGKQLKLLALRIAEQCPESSTKQDLLAYLDKITLFTHQLEITSRVKADVQNIGGEQVVSALDSATSLIQAAKNLMNAVVLTVKASFVASTKYTHRQQQAAAAAAAAKLELNGLASAVAAAQNPIVVWKMKAPEKKPLVKREKPEDSAARVRRGSLKRSVPPIKALAEFTSPS